LSLLLLPERRFREAHALPESCRIAEFRPIVAIRLGTFVQAAARAGHHFGGRDLR
jgi:hypothetical protein